MIGLDDLFTRLETALEAGGIAWWEVEFPSGVIFFSDLKATIIGRKPTEFTHYGQFIDLMHPDDRKHVDDAINKHLEGKAPTYETKYRIKHKDGRYLTLFERGKIVSQKGGITKLAGIVIDVDEQKQVDKRRKI